MDKTTKYCDLKMRLADGSELFGHFHVPLRTGSTIRPSDALRQASDGFLVITGVRVRSSERETQHDSVLVPLTSISYIELPSGWTAR